MHRLLEIIVPVSGNFKPHVYIVLYTTYKKNSAQARTCIKHLDSALGKVNTHVPIDNTASTLIVWLTSSPLLNAWFKLAFCVDGVPGVPLLIIVWRGFLKRLYIKFTMTGKIPKMKTMRPTSKPAVSPFDKEFSVKWNSWLLFLMKCFYLEEYAEPCMYIKIIWKKLCYSCK